MLNFHRIFYSVSIFIAVGLLTGIKKSVAQSTTPRPNILLLLTDDMKWNSATIMDSSYLLPTPNIDRIGHEGANINYYSTNSICVPGRTSLLTGLYGHRTGVMNNSSALSNDKIILPQVLHNSGYYVALIGKWMVNFANPSPDFDYWIWTPGSSSYVDIDCKFWDSSFVATGHLTDMVTDSALQLISRIDTPFFLMMSYNAPHAPWIGQPQFDGMFDATYFPQPPNPLPYTKDYPSYLYADSGKIVKTDEMYQACMRNYSELMAGVNESSGKLLDALTARNLLNNTMVIFTTDNGFMIGEHKIVDKYKPYDDCMRMPLLIRYPPWFPSGTLMNENFALNIDIAPTIFDAVGIPDTFNMDGISIRKFFNSTESRSEFLYEQAPPDSANPVCRSVRDHYFQYTRYFCLDTTEELFDMVNDHLQTVNLVRDSAFKNILYQYRFKLDSIRLATDDTIVPPLFPCYLKTDPVDSSGVDLNLFSVFPNPSGQYFFLQCNRKEIFQAQLFNYIGQQTESFSIDFSGLSIQQIQLKNEAAGIYLLK
ncbi:MAG: sulfatase-like hydrolase/transferase, partial [Bacteroidota bacterium]